MPSDIPLCGCGPCSAEQSSCTEGGWAGPAWRFDGSSDVLCKENIDPGGTEVTASCDYRTS